MEQVCNLCSGVWSSPQSVDNVRPLPALLRKLSSSTRAEFNYVGSRSRRDLNRHRLSISWHYQEPRSGDGRFSPEKNSPQWRQSAYEAPGEVRPETNASKRYRLEERKLLRMRLDWCYCETSSAAQAPTNAGKASKLAATASGATPSCSAGASVASAVPRPGKNCSPSAKIGRGSNKASPSKATALIRGVAACAGSIALAAPAAGALIKLGRFILFSDRVSISLLYGVPPQSRILGRQNRFFRDLQECASGRIWP